MTLQTSTAAFLLSFFYTHVLPPTKSSRLCASCQATADSVEGCLSNIYPPVWMKGTANPGTHTGLARPFYLRIAATRCNTNSMTRRAKKIPNDGWMSPGHERVSLLIVFHLPLAGDAAAPMFSLLYSAYKLDLRRAHAATTSASVFAAMPLWFS